MISFGLWELQLLKLIVICFNRMRILETLESLLLRFGIILGCFFEFSRNLLGIRLGDSNLVFSCTRLLRKRRPCEIERIVTDHIPLVRVVNIADRFIN